MILHSLRLRNFKGLLAGVGLAEVFIDFGKLPPAGLVAIVGGNGMGKTTLLDNMHPYRLMPYKLRKAAGWSPSAFSFYDQCAGSDAEKDLVFEMDGVIYRSKLLIDADRRKQEAYLYRSGGLGARDWQPLNDGKTRTYDEAVERLCGSPSLFFTSVFRAQGAKNLSDYTRGDIMAVVAELLNIDHILEQGKKAREVASVLLAEVDGLSRDRAILDAESGGLDALVTEKQGVESAVADAEAVSRAAKARIDDLLKRRSEFEVANAAEASTKQRLEDKRGELARVRNSIAGIEQEHQANLSASRQRADGVRAEIDAGQVRHDGRMAELFSRRQSVERVLSRADEIREAACSQLGANESLQKATDRLQALRDEYASAQAEASALASLPAQIAAARNVLASLQTRAGALSSLDCFADGSGTVNEACPLLKDAVEAKGRIAAAQEDIAALEGRLGALSHWNQKLANLKAEGDRVRADQEAAKRRVADLMDLARLLPEVDAADARLVEIAEDERREAQQWGERKAMLEQSLASELAMVDHRLANEDGRLAPLRDEQARLSREIEELSAAVTGDFSAKLREVDYSVGMERTALDGADSKLRDLQAAVGRLDAKIETARKAAGKLAEIGSRIDAINADVADWNLLAKACSNDGIVALELDDAGPTIASISNDLLKSCYGPRFSVRLETQSAKVNGDMKEVFDITVFDSETSEVKSITEMSGGQVCWIEDALTRAICLFNINRSDRVFGTIYSDEKDGALDASRKCEFMAVKRRSLQIGSHSRELFITQTPDLIDMADAVIRLAPGSVFVEVR